MTEPGYHRQHGILRQIARFAPMPALRRWLLSRLPGMTLGAGATVGFGTLVAVDGFVLGPGVTIGRFNRFVGPFTLTAGAGTIIGAKNRFLAGGWILEPKFTAEGYARRMTLGRDCLITDGHLFDIVGGIDIGDNSWIAGEGSQFWTHGVGAADRDIVIGPNCYLGAAIRVAPGGKLGAGSILSLGSVLTRDLSHVEDALVGGIPAAEIKSLADDYASGRLQRHGTAA